MTKVLCLGSGCPSSLLECMEHSLGDFPAFTTCPAGITTFTQGLSDMMFLCFQDEIRAFFSKRDVFVLCSDTALQTQSVLLCCYYRDSSENLSKEAMFVQRFSQCSEAYVVRDLAYAFWAFSLSCECKKCS